MNDTNTKVCPKCLKKFSLDQFKIDSKGKPHSYCKPCEIAYYREYNGKRYASPEAQSAESKRGRDRYQTQGRPARKDRKYKMIQLLGGCCTRCGYKQNAAALDFDHITPVDKKRNMSYLLAINLPWGWDAAVEESKNCQLVCSNCHRAKTHPDWEMSLLSKSADQLGGTLLQVEPTVDVGDGAS